MDSVLDITLTGTNPTSTQNNYYVDSTMVRVDSLHNIGISSYASVNNVKVSVYPNPGNGVISVSASNDLGLITICNSLGEIIYKEKINSTVHQIDLSKYPSGVFMLQAQGRFIRLVKE